MHRLLNWLTAQQKPVNLWETFTWQQAFSAWRNPGQQQEPILFRACELGAWEARALLRETSAQVMDCGHLWPLPLTAGLDLNSEKACRPFWRCSLPGFKTGEECE